MSSQAESLGSWASFLSAPPSYSSFQRDLRLDGPRTPLLQDYDGVEEEGEEEVDGGLIMTAPRLHYPPPPAYSQVRHLYYSLTVFLLDNGNVLLLKNVTKKFIHMHEVGF